MKVIPGTVEGGHVMMTGPIQGVVQLEDGRTVDVSPPWIEVSDEDAEEIAHRIGVRHMVEGHPSHVERDDDPESETHGEMIQRPFYYVPPEKFHGDLKGLKAAGTPYPDENKRRFVHPDHAKGFVPTEKKG